MGLVDDLLEEAAEQEADNGCDSAWTAQLLRQAATVIAEPPHTVGGVLGTMTDAKLAEQVCGIVEKTDIPPGDGEDAFGAAMRRVLLWQRGEIERLQRIINSGTAYCESRVRRIVLDAPEGESFGLLMDRAEAEIGWLRARKADAENSTKAAMDETCVPLLRKEIERLRYYIQTIQDIATDPAFEPDAMGWTESECKKAAKAKGARMLKCLQRIAREYDHHAQLRDPLAWAVAEIERLRSKLRRTRDYLKFAANSPGDRDDGPDDRMGQNYSHRPAGVGPLTERKL